MAVLDHLVYAVDDLDAGRRWLAQRTGVEAVFGGSHPGRGTHNAVASFGSGYVELIAPDPAQSAPRGHRPFGLDELVGQGLVAYAVRPAPGDSIDALVARARTAGHDPGEPEAMSRRQPDGSELHWRLTFPVGVGGAIPFVIDWGSTARPSDTAPGGLELLGFTVVSPDVVATRSVLAALGLDVAVETGPVPSVSAVLRGPDGSAELAPAPRRSLA